MKSLIITVVLGSTISLLAACRPPHTESLTARVDQLFAEWNRTDSPSCSVGISRNGTVMYEHGYGMANLELGVPITPTSVLGAASISKQFTAMSILLLAERGQLSLDDEVRTYIPEWADREHRVTIRHLLNHTSGLREGFGLLGWAIPGDGSVDTNTAMVPMLARQRGRNFVPGTEFQYNNGGYNLLGSIVKRVSGQSLRAFADTKIFKPLGMTSTYFRDDAAMIIPNRAAGYSRDRDGLHQASEAVGVVGNAGLYTTARDLLRWDQNFAEVRVGTQAVVAAMQTPAVLIGGSTSPYGLGLWVGQYRGLRTVAHGGGDRGIAAYFVRYPDQRFAVAVLCNLDTINVIGLTQGVADIYLADMFAAPSPSRESAPPPRVTVSVDALALTAGLYRNEANDGVLRISVRDGTLIGRNFYGEDTDFELIPVSPNRFLFPASTVSLQFVPETADGVSAWHVIDSEGRTLEVVQSTAFVPSTEELRPLVGEYRSPELDVTYRVVTADFGLIIRPPGRADIPLQPVAKDTFAGPVVGTVKFLRDPGGAIAGFTLNRYSARGVRFDRLNRVG